MGQEASAATAGVHSGPFPCTTCDLIHSVNTSTPITCACWALGPCDAGARRGPA